jgi:hypothetical protein
VPLPFFIIEEEIKIDLSFRQRYEKLKEQKKTKKKEKLLI